MARTLTVSCDGGPDAGAGPRPSPLVTDAQMWAGELSRDDLVELDVSQGSRIKGEAASLGSKSNNSRMRSNSWTQTVTGTVTDPVGRAYRSVAYVQNYATQTLDKGRKKVHCVDVTSRGRMPLLFSCLQHFHSML